MVSGRRETIGSVETDRISFSVLFRYRNCRFGRFGPFSFYIVETAIDFFLFSAETDVGFSVQSEADGS